MSRRPASPASQRNRPGDDEVGLRSRRCTVWPDTTGSATRRSSREPSPRPSNLSGSHAGVGRVGSRRDCPRLSAWPAGADLRPWRDWSHATNRRTVDPRGSVTRRRPAGGSSTDVAERRLRSSGDDGPGPRRHHRLPMRRDRRGGARRRDRHCRVRRRAAVLTDRFGSPLARPGPCSIRPGHRPRPPPGWPAGSTAARAPWRVVDIVVASVLGVAGGLFRRLERQLRDDLCAARSAPPRPSRCWPACGCCPGVLGALVIRRAGRRGLHRAGRGGGRGADRQPVGLLGRSGTALLEGLGAEIVFALLLYRRFGLPTAMLAGAAAGSWSSACSTSLLGYPTLSAGWKLALRRLLARCCPGAVIAGARLLGADPGAGRDRRAGAAGLRAHRRRASERGGDGRLRRSALRARGWGWRHAGRTAWAVRGLDLDVGPGERVLLLGASGAGKSTLLAGVRGSARRPGHRGGRGAEHENGGESTAC